LSGLQQIYWGQNLRSPLYAKSKEQSSSKKKVLLSQVQQSLTSRKEFFKDMYNWIVSANIPGLNSKCSNFGHFWKRAASNIFQSSQRFENIICYGETLENMRATIGDAFTWVALDETTDSVGRLIANIVAGKLGIGFLYPNLICFKVLNHTNHFTVARFVNDGLKMRWHTGVNEKVPILYSVVSYYKLLKKDYSPWNYFDEFLCSQLKPCL
jgi:hypothetical protein